MSSIKKYRIVEIFESLQGEGYNTGMRAIFIRFGKCNLACGWCDTPYNQFYLSSLEGILDQVVQYTARNIIITGGEPTIQPDIDKLIFILKKMGYFIALETNGIKPIPIGIDYVAVSPKKAYDFIYLKKALMKADEVRVVVDGDVVKFCQLIENKIQAKNYYLSPCERDASLNMLETIQQLGILNAREKAQHWNLSIQTHKLANIA